MSSRSIRVQRELAGLTNDRRTAKSNSAYDENQSIEQSAKPAVSDQVKSRAALRARPTNISATLNKDISKKSAGICFGRGGTTTNIKCITAVDRANPVPRNPKLSTPARLQSEVWVRCDSMLSVYHYSQRDTSKKQIQTSVKRSNIHEVLH